MNPNAKTGSYGLLMVVVIVAVDILFFRHHFSERLLANLAIVLLFVMLYLGLLKRRW